MLQKYERILTSDIPNLEGAEFDPAYVKDVAQNILLFLKAKATEFGHTYWLYKGLCQAIATVELDMFERTIFVDCKISAMAVFCDKIDILTDRVNRADVSSIKLYILFYSVIIYFN